MLVALAVAGIGSGARAASGADVLTGDVLTGPAAFGDWHADRPGVRRLIRPEDLPTRATDSEASSPSIVRQPEGVAPRVPPGFRAERVATGLEEPRAMRTAPNGDVFLAESGAGRVLVLPGGDAAHPAVFASGLERPFGIAFLPAASPTAVLVAETNRVVRFPYRLGATAAPGAPAVVVPSLPTGGHWTRDLVAGKDGLFLAVGSDSNVAAGMPVAPPGGAAAWEAEHGLGAAWGDEAGRANVLTLSETGAEAPYATGLRNCVGEAIAPGSGDLWCVVNERDRLGDDLPFDYATRVRRGGFYGWPWFYIGDHEDSRVRSRRPDLAGKVVVPDVLLQAHSAPLGIAFYTGTAFPPEYRGDAFVTMHGSWNRAKITGYKVVRLRFDHGTPTGEYDDFMTGFVLDDDHVFGRPVGVTMTQDGALLVSEDGNGTLWRISYGG